MKKATVVGLLTLLLMVNVSGSARKAIRGGTFITITQGTIANGVALIENGKIQAVGANLSVPEGYEVIEASGKFITPGFILAYSQVGLEGDGVSRDYVESTDAITPEMRAIDGFYPFSRTIPNLRRRGITTVAVFPEPTNVVSGQGAVLKLHGKLAEKMAIQTEAGLMISLGEKSKRTSGMPQTRMGEIYLLRKNLNDARDYLRKKQDAEKDKDGTKRPVLDLKLEALASLLKGEFPAFVQCYKVQDMMNAIKLSEEYGFKLVLVDASEAHRVSQEISERKIPVLVGAFSRESEMTSDTWDPRNAALLNKAGVLLALIPGGEWPVYGVEELAFYAAYAIRHGLPEEDALKAVTINPARILGIAERVGSLDKGKDADLVIFDGHPFFVKSRVEKLMIDGVLFEID